MASNFDQKELLESNNTRDEAKVSGGAKAFMYVLWTLPVGLGWIYFVQKKNWFRSQRERILEQLANIDAKLTERFNVLSNQLNVAKEALKHEKELLTEVTQARAAATASNIGNPQGVVQKEALVAGLASRFNMVREAYPELATMGVMQGLNDTIKDIEADLEAQRRFYSASARKFNTALKQFPSNIAAESEGAKRFPMFEAQDQHRANVEMKF